MVKVKLSVMLFLQYLMMPVWFVPLLPYVRTLDGGQFNGCALPERQVRHADLIRGGELVYEMER